MKYRCKVRKPNGEIVDGCGHEGTYEGSCDDCGLGFMRHKLSGGGDLSERVNVVRSVHARVRALLFAEAMPPDQSSVDGTVRETIALLQSLLPASPERDKQAQVAMATDHNTRADTRELRAYIDRADAALQLYSPAPGSWAHDAECARRCLASIAESRK